ncbi:MAG TPA: hypothetical protein VMH39_14980, partial [Gemmatimonadaceae bacterium]|nr:hypothetical protein [Gemmatimonadaceae bacterium]
MVAPSMRAGRHGLASIVIGLAAFAGGLVWQRGTAPPRASDPDAARIESEVLVELNRARANPSAFAQDIEQLVPLYDGTLLHRPGWTIPERTIEGVTAARSAILALRATH